MSSSTSRIGAGLAAGGALFFIGGGMHPGDDPPGLSLKEHLLLLYEDPSWYRSHTVLLGGMVLIAASLVALARQPVLASNPRMRAVAKISAITAILAAASGLLHLISAVDADRIAAGVATPITDANLIVETLVIPAFGLAIATLAAVGAATGTLGTWIAAILGVVGGIAYALAAGTALFTDALNFLFPVAAGIAVWAVVIGLGLLLSRRATTGVRAPAALHSPRFPR